ncbi:MAG: 23S rRNA (adenine(2503)-C(2))-methyltransferase RlmN [Candidatus Sulfobium sp.]
MKIHEKINLKALSRDDIFCFVKDLGLPRYRANQLLHWMYDRCVRHFSEISEFSFDLRRTLDNLACMESLELLKNLKSEDGTEKFLFSLSDGLAIESVLIRDKDRRTLCVSSQAGCAMGCRFCLTGTLGLARNLGSHEIVDQIISVNRFIRPEKITNIVFMGMGEPLANFDEVVEALWRIVNLVGISRRKVTISTAGLANKIPLLSESAPDINLAVSLNAATDGTRDKIMPVNRSYPLKSLLDACGRYHLKPRRRITFEYVLIQGINDSPEEARMLADILRGLRCKVNLIPLNPHPGSDFGRPSDESILKFQKILVQRNLTALIRESKGADILAACGQLRAEHQ